MIRIAVVALLGGLVLVGGAVAQPVACRMRWQTGQTLTYRVSQQMQATEVLNGSSTESASKLDLVKRWQVQAVDQAGVATLQLSILSMRLETLVPGGDPLVFDSTTPDKSNPQMRESLGQYVGVPLATLQIDSLGRMIKVVESKHGSANRYEVELPFVCQLPATGVQTGQRWERAFTIQLDPPHGTGEKHPAAQKYHCKSLVNGKAVIEVQTDVTAWPKAPGDQIPLLQKLPTGEVVFDLQTGRMESSRMQISREVKDHQGQGSSYRFVSNYTEQFVPAR